MKFKLSDLWRWDGTIGRGVYLFWGALLLAFKYNLDRAVLRIGFDRDWSFMDYFRPTAPFDSADQKTQALILLALSFPFLWAGLILTVRRLRSIERPLWLAGLFVVPVLKWFLFAALAILPAPVGTKSAPPDRKASAWLDPMIPTHPLGSAMLGLGISLVLAMTAMLLGVELLSHYGWGLFVGAPFAMGFMTVLIYGYHEPRPFRDCLVAALLPVALAGAAFLAFAMEGVICLMMAAPLAAGIALIGGAAAYFIQAGRREDTPKLVCAAFLIVPALIGGEYWQQAPARLLRVRTAAVVNANPEQVWRHVVAFTDLPEPTEWLFRLGIAYPKRAEIRGRGAGAIRHCVFSTGPFVEPIEIWDEPRLLKFSVTQNPAPMEEWTPYQSVHPPHLDGFLVSNGGQFLLEPLTGGRTRLEGTTWYYHHLWPAGYWQLWSDFIIHRIHQRVLNHIKKIAEDESFAAVKIQGGSAKQTQEREFGKPPKEIVHVLRTHPQPLPGGELLLKHAQEVPLLAGVKGWVHREGPL
ncbi:MAG: hypothetical protein HYY23_15980 [Verrucomicrobia bacterium]|nr:hypothetical protein [Verrucomicrobiota bacterium]